MFGRFSPTPREVELRGTSAELSQLAVRVRGGADHGTFEVVQDPAPYESSLLAWRLVAGPDLAFDVEPEAQTLFIAAGPQAVETFAGNLEALAEEGRGAHVHLEHLPGTGFVREGSWPVVIVVSDGGSS